jgi:hypothetical protein
MTEFLPFIFGLLTGAVVAILAIAYRWREPGEPVMATLVRPFSGGGPGPRK